LTAVLAPVLAALAAAERRALEYASLLAPDYVPLPWLRTLLTSDFPELAQSSRLSDPWSDACRRLQRLALFTPAEGQGHAPRLVRVHRLLNQAGLYWHGLSEWSRAEPLMRRALAIDEQSYGADHPTVAIGLNNLAQLLKATNRLAEAEPLMRRMVEIFLKFTRATECPHPHLQAALGNYAGLLQAMGRRAADVRRELNELLSHYGVSLD
jgi:hypothetical protein